MVQAPDGARPHRMTLNPIRYRAARRDSRGELMAPLGRLWLWCPTPQAMAKVVAQLRKRTLDFGTAEGECVVLDVEYEVLRDLVVPLRRVLTHQEAEDTKVLYKPAGGELTTADFPRVQSYLVFSRVSQASWLSELLEGDRLTAVLQPIVYATEPTKVYAREALLRGLGRDDAIVYPSYLYDVARGCGMLDRLDLRARQAAVDTAVRDGLAEKLFINLTPSAIHDPIFELESTIAMIDRAGIAHGNVVFEVVESEHVGDVPNLRGLLDTYRQAGFRVALDDVGSGYSSLNLLHQVRPDYVKLDMALLRNVHQDPYKALIAEKIIEIATRLGIWTIAEGIEQEGELEWAAMHGASYLQGYMIARPSEARFGTGARNSGGLVA